MHLHFFNISQSNRPDNNVGKQFLGQLTKWQLVMHHFGLSPVLNTRVPIYTPGCDDATALVLPGIACIPLTQPTVKVDIKAAKSLNCIMSDWVRKIYVCMLQPQKCIISTIILRNMCSSRSHQVIMPTMQANQLIATS